MNDSFDILGFSLEALEPRVMLSADVTAATLGVAVEVVVMNDAPPVESGELFDAELFQPIEMEDEVVVEKAVSETSSELEVEGQTVQVTLHEGEPFNTFPAQDGDASNLLLLEHSLSARGPPEGRDLTYPDLPGLRLSPESIGQTEGQIFYLNFEGAENLVFRGPGFDVVGIDVPAFFVPGAVEAETPGFIGEITAALNGLFEGSGISFVTSAPADGEYSTIYIGGEGEDFREWGFFLGLAEQVDAGNLNRDDNAFVFSEAIWREGMSVDAYAEAVGAVIAREAGRLVGYANVAEVSPDSPLYGLAQAETKILDVAALQPDTSDAGRDWTLGISFGIVEEGMHTFVVATPGTGWSMASGANVTFSVEDQATGELVTVPLQSTTRTVNTGGGPVEQTLFTASQNFNLIGTFTAIFEGIRAPDVAGLSEISLEIHDSSSSPQTPVTAADVWALEVMTLDRSDETTWVESRAQQLFDYYELVSSSPLVQLIYGLLMKQFEAPAVENAISPLDYAQIFSDTLESVMGDVPTGNSFALTAEVLKDWLTFGSELEFGVAFAGTLGAGFTSPLGGVTLKVMELLAALKVVWAPSLFGMAQTGNDFDAGTLKLSRVTALTAGINVVEVEEYVEFGGSASNVLGWDIDKQFTSSDTLTFGMAFNLKAALTLSGSLGSFFSMFGDVSQSIDGTIKIETTMTIPEFLNLYRSGDFFNGAAPGFLNGPFEQQPQITQLAAALADVLVPFFADTAFETALNSTLVGIIPFDYYMGRPDSILGLLGISPNNHRYVIEGAKSAAIAAGLSAAYDFNPAIGSLSLGGQAFLGANVKLGLKVFDSNDPGYFASLIAQGATFIGQSLPTFGLPERFTPQLAPLMDPARFAADPLWADNLQYVKHVTVITHGYQFFDGEDSLAGAFLGSPGDAMYALATQIRQQTGGWLVDYDIRSQGGLGGIDVGGSVFPGEFALANASGPDGLHVVLLFDWAPESNETSPEWAVAAGEALVALLAELGLLDVLTPEANPFYHFIGHGLGAVVTSEAVRLLGAHSVKVDHLTYLDPHDFNQNITIFGVPVNPFTSWMDPSGLATPAGYGVAVWDNVVFADNYFQTVSGLQSLVNPVGRPIPGAFNADVTSLMDSWGVFSFNLPTSQVWANFYLNTVRDLTQKYGYYWSRAGNEYGNAYGHDGVDRRPNPRFYVTDLPVDKDLVFVSVPGGPLDNQAHAYSSPVLVDTSTGFPNSAGLDGLGLTAEQIRDARWAPGRAAFGLAPTGTLTGSGNVIPGWSHHGGGGNATLTPDGYLRFTEFNTTRTRNKLLIPRNAGAIAFDLQLISPTGMLGTLEIDLVTRLPSENGDAVTTVFLGKIELSELTNNMTTHAFLLAPELRGKVFAIEFNLLTQESGVLLNLDNPRFVHGGGTGDLILVDFHDLGAGSPQRQDDLLNADAFTLVDVTARNPDNSPAFFTEAGSGNFTNMNGTEILLALGEEVGKIYYSELLYGSDERNSIVTGEFLFRPPLQSDLPGDISNIDPGFQGFFRFGFTVEGQEGIQYAEVYVGEMFQTSVNTSAFGGFEVSPDTGPVLGSLSAFYETGFRYESFWDESFLSAAGRVSVGTGDFGGISYGMYQFPSRVNGVVSENSNVMLFLNASGFIGAFDGLSVATPEFGEMWKMLADPDAVGIDAARLFAIAQHDYVELQNHVPLVNSYLAAYQIDVNTRSRALQNVVWSTGVQHGGGTNVLTVATRNLLMDLGLTSAQAQGPQGIDLLASLFANGALTQSQIQSLISAGRINRNISNTTMQSLLESVNWEVDMVLASYIYLERGVDNEGNGILNRFASSSPEVQASVLKRFFNDPSAPNFNPRFASELELAFQAYLKEPSPTANSTFDRQVRIEHRLEFLGFADEDLLVSIEKFNTFANFQPVHPYDISPLIDDPTGLSYTRLGGSDVLTTNWNADLVNTFDNSQIPGNVADYVVGGGNANQEDVFVPGSLGDTLYFNPFTDLGPLDPDSPQATFFLQTQDGTRVAASTNPDLDSADGSDTHVIAHQSGGGAQILIDTSADENGGIAAAFVQLAQGFHSLVETSENAWLVLTTLSDTVEGVFVQAGETFLVRVFGADASTNKLFVDWSTLQNRRGGLVTRDQIATTGDTFDWSLAYAVDENANIGFELEPLAVVQDIGTLHSVKYLVVDNIEIGYDRALATSIAAGFLAAELTNRDTWFFDENGFQQSALSTETGAFTQSVNTYDPRVWSTGAGVATNGAPTGLIGVQAGMPDRHRVINEAAARSVRQGLNLFIPGLTSVLNTINELQATLETFGNLALNAIGNVAAAAGSGVHKLQEAFRIVDQIAGTGDPLNLEKLNQRLAQLAGQDSLTLNIPFSIPDSLVFDFTFTRTFTPITLDFDLALGGAWLGIEGDAQITLTPKLTLNMSFGIEDLYTPNMVDSFFAEVGGIVFSLEAETSEPVNISANVGLLGVSVEDGEAMAGVSLVLSLPRVTGEDLAQPGFSFQAPSVKLTGTLDVDLPLAANFGSVSLTQGDTPRVRIADSNLFAAPPPMFAVENFENLFSFSDLTLQDYINALRDIFQFIAEQVGQSDVMDRRLPVIGASINDLFDFAGEFLDMLDDLESGAARTIQELEAALRSLLGLDPGDETISLTYDHALRLFLLDFDFIFAQVEIDTPVQFDLADLLSGQSNQDAVDSVGNFESFAGIYGEGNVSGSAGLTFSFGFGLDLSGEQPVFFLQDNAVFEATLGFAAEEIELNAYVGTFAISVQDGTVYFDEDGEGPGTAPASFTLNLAPNSGRYLMSELGSISLEYDITGALDVNLPMFFNGSPIGDEAEDEHIFLVQIPDLANFLPIPQPDSITFSPPNFASLAHLFDVNNLTDFWFWLGTALDFVADFLDGEVFGINLPFIGDKLKNEADFVRTLKEELGFFMEDEVNTSVIRQEIFNVLGPAGLNILKAHPDHPEDPLGPGGQPRELDIDDIVLTAGVGGVYFDVLLGQDFPVEVDIDFDVGLPGLGLAVDAQLDVTFGWGMRLGFGVDLEKGFYINSNNSGAAGVVDLPGEAPVSVGDNEIYAYVVVDLKENSELSGSLGFLNLDLVDNGSIMAATFSVDIRDPNNDGFLTFGEILGGGPMSDFFAVEVRVNSLLDLHAKVSVGPEGETDFLPAIEMDIVLEWDSDPSLPGGNAFNLSFNNIGINLGRFISGFINPIFGRIQQILQPIQPLINLLSTRIPVLSDIAGLRNLFDRNGDGEVWLLELAPVSDETFQAINAIVGIANLISILPNSDPDDDNLVIYVGSFSLSDLQGLLNPNFDLSSVNTPENEGVFGSLVNQISSGASGGAQDFFNAYLAEDSLEGASSSNKIGWKDIIQFPLLTRPQLAFDFLLGKPVDLFRFDIPTIEIELPSLSITVPVVGPIGVRFGFESTITLNLGFGYDTYGLRNFAVGPSGEFSNKDDNFTRPADLLDGFYIINGDAEGNTIPIAVIDLTVQLAAGLNAGIVSVEVGGEFGANIMFSFADGVGENGKVRGSDIIAGFQAGCLFQTSGSFNVGLFVEGRIGPFRHRIDIVQVTLANFDVGCKEEASPSLGSVDEDGILTLHMGPYAYRRNEFSSGVNNIDGDEEFTVDHVSGEMGNETVSVTWEGYTQVFEGVSLIKASGGAGDDKIILTGSVLSGAELDGGQGNDTLIGSRHSPNKLFGGPGDDILVGGNKNDILRGGAGNDTIYGVAGNNIIRGGPGHNTLYGGSGNDNIKIGDIIVGNYNNLIYAGGGNNEIHGGAGDDEIYGGDGNDLIYAGTGNNFIHGGSGNNIIYGGPGNDIIYGGAGDDIIYGGSGNDMLYGDEDEEFTVDNVTLAAFFDGEMTFIDLDSGVVIIRPGRPSGNDIIFGQGGDDYINVGRGNNIAVGGYNTFLQPRPIHPDPDWNHPGNNTIVGGPGNDILVGGNARVNVSTRTVLGYDGTIGGNDTIYGTGGTNLIIGGPGSDTIYGGVGSDTIYAFTPSGIGDDASMNWLYGGPGDDTIHGGAGDDYIEGGPGSDTIYGGAGNDTIYAFSQDPTGDDASPNFIYGGAGNDMIFGGAGDDYIEGGAGSDTIYGGAGNDEIYAFSEDGTDDDGSPNFIDGGAGDDIIHGGSGNDILIGGLGDDEIHGGAGDDWIVGGLFSDSGVGHAGDNFITVESGDNIILGDHGIIFWNAGKIFIVAGGGTGDDEIHGGSGNDIIYGQGGNNTIYGGSGDDLIYGHSPDGNPDEVGFNTIYGEDGDDEIHGGFGNNLIYGGAGDDLIYGGPTDDVIYGGDGNDVIYAGAGDNEIYGGAGNDRIFGGPGDDYIEGGAGSDRIYGGSGNDTIYAYSQDPTGDDASPNWIYGEAGNDTIYGGAGDDYIEGGPGSDTIYGGAGNDTIYAFSANPFGDDASPNWIYGGAGNDTIFGGAGDDYIEGGAGSDTIFGGSGNDTIYAFSADPTGDDASPNWIYGQGGNDLIFGGDGDDYIEGGAGSDTIYGGAGNDTIYAYSADPDGDDASPNWIYGGAGNDTIFGGAGDDFIEGGAGSDTIYGGDGNDTIYAFAEDPTDDDASPNWIYGQGGDDLIFGGAGDDYIEGGAGSDTIYGGAGNDTIYAYSADPDGDDASPNWIYGGDGNDTIYGGDGDDYIEGGAGSDTIYGGAGNDTIYAYSADPTGDDASPNFIFGGDGDDLIFGGDGDDYIEGGAGSDTIYGGAGDDEIYAFSADPDGDDASPNWIYGGAGDDLIFGGDGDDYIEGGPGSDTIHGGAGNDTIYAFSANPTGDDASPNWIYGGAGNDTIYGGAGNDYIEGGPGSDWIYGGAGEDIIYAFSADPTGDDASPNFLFGGAGDDLIIGGDGDDYIEGGSGSDLIYGGAGNDTIYAYSADPTGDDGSVNIIYGEDGDDLIFGGLGNDFIDGGAGDDIIHGTGGDNHIVGGEGDDTIHGGPGNDRIYGGPGNDWIDGGDGDDYIHAGEGDNIIFGGAGNDTIYGGPGNDWIDGGDGDDIIFGGGGDNTLYGGAGDDFIYGGPGNNTIYGGPGNDILIGGAGTDTLYGGDGDDILIAGGGVGNRLYGEAGNDILIGSDEGADFDPDFFDEEMFGDLLDGGPGNDWIFGMGGANLIYTGPGNNHVDSGPGADWIIAGDDGNWIFAGYGGGDTIHGGAGDDVIWGSPDGSTTIYGNAGNNIIRGGSFGDFLYGGTGNDDIDGVGGDNWIEGGGGNNTLRAGTGSGSTVIGGDGDDILIGSSGGPSSLDGGDGVNTFFTSFGDTLVSTVMDWVNSLENAPEAATGILHPAFLIAASLASNTASPVYPLAGLSQGTGYGPGAGRSPVSAIDPAVALDSDGATYMAWSDARSGRYEIYVTRFSDSEGWSELAGSASGGGISSSSDPSRGPALAFLPNGDLVVTWSEDGDTRFSVWDGAEWSAPQTAVSGAGEGVLKSAPDGVVLAVSSEEGDVTVTRYDGVTWTQLGTVLEEAGLDFDLAVSPDGVALAASVNGITSVWTFDGAAWNLEASTPGALPAVEWFDEDLYLALVLDLRSVWGGRELRWFVVDDGLTSMNHEFAGGDVQQIELIAGGGQLHLYWIEDAVATRQGTGHVVYGISTDGMDVFEPLPGISTDGRGLAPQVVLPGQISLAVGTDGTVVLLVQENGGAPGFVALRSLPNAVENTTVITGVSSGELVLDSADDGRVYYFARDASVGSVDLAGAEGVALVHGTVTGTVSTSAASSVWIEHMTLGGLSMDHDGTELTLLDSNVGEIAFNETASVTVADNRIQTVEVNATPTGVITRNEIGGGAIGVTLNAPAPMFDNIIRGSAIGIRYNVTGFASAFGYHPGSGRNWITGNETGVLLVSGRLSGQLLSHNQTGVLALQGTQVGPDHDDWMLANHFLSNDVAVRGDADRVQFNVFRYNETAVLAMGNRQWVAHNLFAQNDVAFRVFSGTANRFVHNSVYTEGGDGVVVEGGSETYISNNIFFVKGDTSTAIRVLAYDGFYSDHNLRLPDLGGDFGGISGK